METVVKRFSLCSIEEMNDMRVCKWWQKFYFQVNYSFKGVRESDLKTCQAVLCCGEERTESREMRGCHTHFTQKQLVIFYLLTTPMKHSLSLTSSHLSLSFSFSFYPSIHPLTLSLKTKVSPRNILSSLHLSLPLNLFVFASYRL